LKTSLTPIEIEVESEPPSDRTRQSRLIPRPMWLIVTLLASVAYTPLTLYGAQGHALSRGYRLIGYTLVVAVLLGVLAHIISYLPVRRSAAWFAVSIGWFVVAAGGSVSSDLATWILVSLIILPVAVVLLLNRSRFLDTLMVAFTAYLIVAPAPSLLTGGPLGEDEAVPGYVAASGTPSTDSRPDVWFLVLDGYPSGSSRVEDFDATSDPLGDLLRESGFVVEPDALAPYTRTVGALPAILAGTMIFPAGSLQDAADMQAATEVIAGDSTLVRGLRDIGYHTTMIESGWHQSRCGEFIDECVKSALVDEMGSALLSASMIPHLFGIDRHVHTVIGTERTFNALNNLATGYSSNSRPDLVVAHSLAPHPPMLLDQNCARQGPAPNRSSLLLSYDGWDDALIAERATTFMEQVACVDAMVAEFVQSLPAEDVIVVVGDHGSEIRGQVSAPPADWTEDMLRERLQTLAAVRFPGCREPVVRATVEIVPGLFACFGLDLPKPELSALIMATVTREDGSQYPLYELSAEQTLGLLQGD
jgi:hypothetical protein